MKNKSFDCVEMKHNAATQIGSKVSAFSIQEQLAYWNQKATELQERLLVVAMKKDCLKLQQKLFKGMNVDELHEKSAVNCAEASSEYKEKR